MIKPGFLDPGSRRDLIDLARDGSVPHRLARRANALVLLDQGMSCSAVAIAERYRTLAAECNRQLMRRRL
jgi:hypothetical protein